MRQCAVSIQRHASFYSRAGQSSRVSSGRNSGEPSPASLRPKQVRSWQPCLARNHRHVRCTLVAVPAIELQDSREDVTVATHEQCGKSRLSTYALPLSLPSPLPGICMSLANLLSLEQIIPLMKEME